MLALSHDIANGFKLFYDMQVLIKKLREVLDTPKLRQKFRNVFRSCYKIEGAFRRELRKRYYFSSEKCISPKKTQ